MFVTSYTGDPFLYLNGHFEAIRKYDQISPDGLKNLYMDGTLKVKVWFEEHNEMLV